MASAICAFRGKSNLFNFGQLIGNFKMAIYEDELSQTMALSLIPAEELRTKATVDGQLNHYELAKALLNWFHGFFRWVDAPKCEQCGVNGRHCLCD